MGNKKHKHKLSKIKPDEIVTSPDGRLSALRYGKHVFIENRSTPEEHELFLQQAANNLPDITAKINQSIENSIYIIKKFDPLSILNRAYFQVVAASLNKKFPLEQNITYLHALEYVQNIILSLSYEDNEKPHIGEQEDQWELLLENISNIYTNLNSNYHIAKTAYMKLNSHQYKPEYDELHFIAQLYWTNIRGNRYQVYDIPHIKSLLEPHDQVFQELFGISSLEFIDALQKIQRSLSFGIGETYAKMEEYRKLTMEAVEKRMIDNPEVSFDEAFSIVIQENSWQTDIKSLLGKAFHNDLFDLEKVTLLPKNLLDELSWIPGEETSFLEGENKGWPLKLSPIKKRPFIKIDNKYYCFNLYNLMDNIYKIVRRVIIKLKPEYEQSWTNKQTDVTEKLPIELFNKLLPSNTNYKNLYYRFRENSSKKEQWAEVDGLVIYDDTLIILEVKAGAYTYTSPTDDFDSHILSLKALLEKPWEQAKRFENQFRNCGEIALYSLVNGKYEFIDSLRLSKFKNIFSCGITLDNLTPLAHDIDNLNYLGIKISDYPLWSISIDNLRVYADIFQSAVQFIHFLEERQRAFSSSYVKVQDELDHLGLYLIHNRYVTYLELVSKNFPPSKRAPLINEYTSELDKYYHNLLIKPQLAELPMQKMPEIFQKILENLVSQQKPGHRRVASYLLDMDGNARDDLANMIPETLRKKINNNKFLPLSMFGQIRLTVDVRFFNFNHTNEALKDYTLASIYGFNEPDRLALELVYSEDEILVDVNWEFLTKQDILPDRLEEIAYLSEKFKQTRINSGLQQSDQKKIKRNEPCLCGSGKKYKKCHGA